MIPFNNLKLANAQLQHEVNAATQRVLQSGWFILGPELEVFEAAFAAYHGIAYAIGVANGTDAIELALRAAGIGAGDEVITVAHTAVATVCAVEQCGARPILVDIDPTTYTMSVTAAEAAITPRTKALLPVHLYGHPANLADLTALAARKHLLLIEDCAQAHGARFDDRLVGTWGQLAAFSFYPTKNLGAYGDGGAVITDDVVLAARLKRLRNYGQTSRYIHQERGINSRLDEMQAAILTVKLAYLDAQNAERRRLADHYRRALQTLLPITLPHEAATLHHVHHLYVIRTPQREIIMEQLNAQSIGTLIHYPVPVHRQQAYQDLGYAQGSLPETERAADEVLSLPMYVGLTEHDIQTVGQALRQALAQLKLV
jgi:dTDP-3-amino-3,4,6-trideoxy-alpha-D-glucose transaminase